MKKLTKLGVLLFLIIFMSGCAEEGNAKTDPRSNPGKPESVRQNQQLLNHYINEEWGFALDYPAGYETKVDREIETEFDFSIRKKNDSEEAKNIDGACSDCAFRIQVLRHFIRGTEEGSFKNPEEWLEFQEKLGNSYTKTTLAGKTTYTKIHEITGRKIFLIFVENGQMYDRYDISIKAKDENAEKILSSFKLL